MPEEMIICVVCGEEVDADLSGWTHGDGGPICPGCNEAVADGAEVYAQTTASGFDYPVGLHPFWGSFGEYRGKN